ncbi:MAG TPA: tetratricopeptide repeat protein [Nitrospiria bacterium]
MAKVNEFKQRLDRNPKDAEALLFLANANYDISRFAQARDYYKQYLQLEPDHPGARTDLASAYYNTQDPDSAILELKEVLKRKPDHPAALYNLGLILAKDGRDPAGSIRSWEALLAAHPGDPRAGEIRQQIELLKKTL